MILVGDWHSAIASECSRGDFDAWRRLTAFVLGGVHSIDYPSDGFRRETSISDCVGAHVFFDVGLENVILHRVWRKRVLILLIGTQFRRWRSGDDVLRDYRPIASLVYKLDELGHQGLGNIFEQREAPDHVSVQSR